MTETGEQKVVFVASPIRMFLLFLNGALLTAVCASIAFRLLPGSEPPLLIDAISWVGIVVFAVASLIFLKRTLTVRGVVVSVDSNGIRDLRLSETAIPWPAIVNSSTVTVSGWKSIYLQLDPAFEKTWKVSSFRKIFKALDALFGVKGYPISVAELTGSFRDLEAAVKKFLERSKLRSVDERERVGS